MIDYYVAARRHFQSGKMYYYAQMAKVQPMNLETIAEIISLRTTVASADVKGVLDSMSKAILFMLKDGHSVRLGDLGSFRLTLASQGHDAEADVKASSIKAARMRFTKGSWLRRNLQPAYCTFRLTDVNGNPVSKTEAEAGV